MDSTFNRVINSTFGLPQQLVWRIWRALKEEDVDLFSKEGLLDPALTPVLGMAFSHANDVEPEEMFGENVWAQLGGSVVTDPLSFLFSAPTLAAKGAHAATKIARSGRLAEFASTEAGVGRMLYGDFKDAAQKAAAKISNPKASRKFQALIDALPSDPNINTVADLMKRGRDHDLLVGAPLIGKATGLSIRVPTYANSWFEMLHSGNKKLVGMAASLAKPMRAIPGVADMFDSLASAGRAISQGRSAATFAPVVGALPDALGHFLTPEMASHVITNSTDLGARLLPRRAKMASLFAKAQAQGKTNEQALAIALGIRPTEKGLARARELYGSILDPTGTLSQEIRIPQTAAELEKNTGLFYGAIQQAQAAISGAEAAVVGGFSKDALQFPGLFKLSKSVTSGLRRRFISDLNLKGDAIQAAERTRKIHQNSILQGAEQVTRDLQEAVRAAADQLGVRPELVHGLMASFAELDPAADEVIEHLRHMGGNSKDALASLNALTDQLVSRAPATLEQAKLQIRNALKGEGVTEQGHAFLQRLLDDIEATVRGSPFDEKVPFVPQALDAEKVTTGGVEFTRPVDLLRPWRHNMVSGGKRVKGRRVGSMTNTEIMEAQVDLERRLGNATPTDTSTFPQLSFGDAAQSTGEVPTFDELGLFHQTRAAAAPGTLPVNQQAYETHIRQLYDNGVITPGQAQILDIAAAGSDYSFMESGGIFGGALGKIGMGKIDLGDGKDTIGLAVGGNQRPAIYIDPKKAQEFSEFGGAAVYAHELGHIVTKFKDLGMGPIQKIHGFLKDELGEEGLKKFIRERLGVGVEAYVDFFAANADEFAAQAFAHTLLTRGAEVGEAHGLKEAVVQIWTKVVERVMRVLGKGNVPKAIQDDAYRAIHTLNSLALGIAPKQGKVRSTFERLRNLIDDNVGGDLGKALQRIAKTKLGEAPNLGDIVDLGKYGKVTKPAPSLGVITTGSGSPIRKVKESTRLGYQRDLEALEAELLDRSQTFDAAGRKLDLSNGRPEELMNREAEIFGRTPTRTRTVPAKQPDSILDLEFVGEVTPLAERVVRLDDARRQMIRWIKQNDGATAMPAAMLEEYTHRLEEYSGSFRKVLRDNLGGDYNVFDAFEDYQRHVLNEAVKGGLIKPGFPLASFTRLLDPEAQIEVNKILGALPQDQVVKINPTMSGFYMRHTNRMSLQELVELNRTLLEEGSEAGKQVGEKLGGFLAAQGYDINKVFTDDPISALTNRLLEVQTAKTNEDFFNAVAGFKESAEAGVLTGKVVGYVDDSMNTVKFDKRVLERTKYADEFDETDVLLEGADVLPSEGTEYLGPGVKRMEDNYRGIVVETREGRQMVIPSAMIGNGYSLNQFATDVPAEDFGKAVVASIARNRHGKYTALPRGADLAAMNGQYIMYGPTGAVDSIVGAVGQQAKDGGPLIKTIYDPIHTAVKMFQTVLRIPEFHFVNLVSAFSQMGLQGVGPKQMTRGMWHAMRFLSAEPELVNKYDRFIRFTAEAGTSKTGIGRRLKTPLSMEFERSARRRAFVGAEDALDDLSNVFQFGDQRVTIREFLQAGIESGGLTGTFAQEGLRSTGSLSSALRGIREQAFATGAKRAVGLTVEAARGVGESSELFARLGGVFAMLESGATLETAWKATTEAMVDYGALTNFEKNVMKRVSSFYTFPRKFVPYAWKEIGKDPSKAALTLNAAFKSSFVHTETGRTELNMGEHRFNLERVMPQMMIPQLMASVADRLFDIRGDTAEGRVGDIMEPSGLLQVAGFEHFLPGRSDGFPQKSAMDRALNLTYLTKWIIQRDNPEVHRSALDEIADKAFGIRKVRPEHERRLLATNYRRLISDLQYQAEREPDAEDRQALLQEAQEIAHTVQALMEK
jgi:hypothetical protein